MGSLRLIFCDAKHLGDLMPFARNFSLDDKRPVKNYLELPSYGFEPRAENWLTEVSFGLL